MNPLALVASLLLLVPSLSFSADVAAIPVAPAVSSPTTTPLPTDIPFSPPIAPRAIAVSHLPIDASVELPISFNEFIFTVQKSNLNYAAQKLNVLIAKAQISLARLWPNPTLNAGYTTPFIQSNSIPGIPEPTPVFSNQDLPKVVTAGISEEIPLGGKLGARVDVATTSMEQSEAQLQDFFRNLRATAASAYIDALTAELNVEQLNKSYVSLQQLADLNAVRYKDGDIAEVDFLQVRIAAQEALSSLHAAESTLEQANIGLAVFAGRSGQIRSYRAGGSLVLQRRTFDTEKLVADAVAHRSDIIAAIHGYQNALAQYHLTEANRIPDVTIGLNYTHNSQSQNAYAPSPSNDQIGFAVSMPIPLSNFDRDDLLAARLTILQNENQLAASRVQAETDVRQAIARYRSAVVATKQYTGGILNDAQRVLDIRIYSYKKGSATLLDVRQAESDLTNTYQNYFAALNEEAKALVNLEQMTGFWDIRLN